MRNFSIFIRLIVAGGLLLIGFLLGTSAAVPSFAEGSAPATEFQAQPVAAIGSTNLTATESLFAGIYNRVAPSVVAITVDGQTALDRSTGSGFVVDRSGHVVTNFHVVDGARRIAINMFDGTITRAEVVGGDRDSDLAVLKVDLSPERLIPVPLGDSSQLVIGQTVLAIGNPFQQDWTLTSGIVSALNRTISGLGSFTIGGVIQTDAAINPGNSGGPLLNLNGEVIGVNSQIQSQTRANSGVGFAVPSNLVRRVITELITSGKMEYSYLGITNRPIDLDLIEQFNLPNNIRGVAVRSVQPSSPASHAGLQTMGVNTIDIITAIDGFPIKSFDDLVGYLAISTTPSQIVEVTIYRNGEVINKPLTLAPRPQ